MQLKKISEYIVDKFQKLISDLRFSLSFGSTLYAKVKILYLLVKPFFSFSKFRVHHIHVLKVKFLGYPMEISVRDNGSDVIILREMFIHQDYRETAQYFTPSVIFDVGANVGLASCYFVSLFPESEVYGFEPESSAYQIAKINFDKNVKKGKLFKLALGAESKEANMLCSEYGSGGQKLEMYDPDSNWKREKVKIQRLDELVQSEKLPIPDLLKIDVEGAEYEVLLGLGEIASKVKGIVMEVHSEELWKKCASFLDKHNFKVLRNEQKFHSEARFVYAEQPALSLTKK